MDKKNGPETGVIDLGSRLSRKDVFHFECNPQVPCFTECCGKLDLLLTPYDAFRLRRRLGVSSGEFLDAYATIRRRTSHGLPEVMMTMDVEHGKRCPFVRPTGCSVYEDRPAACRIYPLGRAATKSSFHEGPQEFFFTVREDHCRGFESSRSWSVEEWVGDQGLEDYNRMNDFLMEIYVTRSRSRKIELGPQHLQMYMMALYNLERFRDFVFKSGFLTKFELDRDTVQSIEKDDFKLLEFAFLWIRFALFGEPVIKVKGRPR
jgi:uncharacterized protein